MTVSIVPTALLRRALALALACATGALLLPPAADAQRATSQPPPPPPAPARVAVSGFRATDLYPGALAFAREWAADAELVYAENADTLRRDGSARAWSFVFASSGTREARGVTVRSDGVTRGFELPFPFDAPAIEAGWLDVSAAMASLERDDPVSAVRAAGMPAAAVLSRGLVAARNEVRTTWLVTYPTLTGSAGQELVLDGLRGSLLARRAITPSATTGSEGAGALPRYLASQRTRFLARIEELRNDPKYGSPARARTLAAREADAAQRLSAQDAARDTLGRAEILARGAEVEAGLARLTTWRARMAANDSALERASARVAAAERDLASERTTELALFLSGEQRARPAKIAVFVDGGEIARATWGEPQWKALDAGAWAEVARAAVRPGSHEVRLEIETPDRRVTTSTWRGSFTEGRLSLLRVRVRGGSGSGSQDPTFEFVAAKTP
ncbi:MAG: hypothetical protein ACREOU_06780 [Candidatus Eiseniibacteriota bacterium]